MMTMMTIIGEGGDGMIKIAILALIAMVSLPHQGECYSAYTTDGVHLIISDNGTPDNLDDDFICDWETE